MEYLNFVLDNIGIIITLIIFLIMMGIMFVVGWKDALREKYENPLVGLVHPYTDEAFSEEDTKAISYLEEKLGRELTEEELKKYWELKYEGHNTYIILANMMVELGLAKNVRDAAEIIKREHVL